MRPQRLLNAYGLRSSPPLFTKGTISVLGREGSPISSEVCACSLHPSFLCRVCMVSISLRGLLGHQGQLIEVTAACPSSLCFWGCSAALCACVQRACAERDQPELKESPLGLSAPLPAVLALGANASSSQKQRSHQRCRWSRR